MKFIINKRYKFNTLAPAVLGDRYSMMRVVGIMTHTEAIKHRDIESLHNNLVPIIPGLPTTTRDCIYVLFKNMNGENLLLANEYIDQLTIQEVNTVKAKVTIDNISSQDIPLIRNALLGSNFTTFNIETEE